MYEKHKWSGHNLTIFFSTWTCPDSSGLPPPTPILVEKTKSGETTHILLQTYDFCLGQSGFPPFWSLTSWTNNIFFFYFDEVIPHSPHLYGFKLKKKWLWNIDPTPKFLVLLSPPVHIARWAHMRHFLSVCLSVWTWPKIRLDNNSYLRNY